MRIVKAAMLLSNVFLAASRLCTSPQYPPSSAVTPHNAISKIAGYVLIDTVPCPMLTFADRGGSGKSVVTSRKHPGLNTRTTNNRMVATQVDSQP